MGSLTKKIVPEKSYELINFKTELIGGILYIKTFKISILREIQPIFSVQDSYKLLRPPNLGQHERDPNNLPYDTNPFERDLYRRYNRLREILKMYYISVSKIYLHYLENSNLKKRISKKQKVEIGSLFNKLHSIIEQEDFSLVILGRYFIDLSFKIAMVGGLSKRYVSSQCSNQEVLNVLVVSPELENICNFTLWVRDSSEKYEEFEKILIELINEKDNKFCRIKNYKLRLPNKILRQSASITLEDTKDYYEWYFVPYLKTSLKSFKENYNPINAMLFTDSKDIEYAIVPKVISGFIYRFQDKNVCILVPTTWGYLNEVWIQIIDSGLLNEIKAFKKATFIHMLVGCYPDESFELRRILLTYNASFTDEIDSIEDAMKKKLYNNMLCNNGLYCGTIELLEGDLNKFMSNFTKGYYKFFRKNLDSGLCDINKLIVYLQIYFKVINRKIYYVPKILSSEKDNIAKIDDYLNNKYEIEPELMLLAERYRLIKNIKKLGENLG